MDCSVIIPVYNSAATLPELVTRLDAARLELANRFEVILVNDGSRDNSWAVIAQLAKENDWLYGLNLMRNYGQHNALLAGIRVAHYEAIVTMDDDLQHPPEEISGLIAKLDEGYDVVYGTPIALQHGLWRNVSSQLTKLVLQSAMGVKIASNASSFRAFRSKLREAFANYDSPFVAIDVLLSWGTTQFAAVPFRQDPRRVGRSNYSFIRLLVLAVELVTGFATWPLRVASLLGFAMMLIGLVVLVSVVGLYLLTGTDVSIYRFIVSIVAIFSGTQLFTLGIMGEYMARMYSRVMARPSYVVREITDKS
jgi:glycosyltransferase involved in cell wall biosynthesis